MIIYQSNKKFSTNNVKKIKAVLKDNSNYIDIPLMINLYRSAHKILWPLKRGL